MPLPGKPPVYRTARTAMQAARVGKRFLAERLIACRAGDTQWLPEKSLLKVLKNN